MTSDEPLQTYSIAKLKAYIANPVNTVDDEMLAWMSVDSREGVRKLARQVLRQRMKKSAALEAVNELKAYETSLHQQGYQYICGVDEVGRGPLAGPVVTCAVILPSDLPPYYFNDSKQLSHQKRKALVQAIEKYALSVEIAVVDNQVIDEINILEATKRAMTMSIHALDPAPEYVLTDAVHLEAITQPQENWIQGDARLYSVAAASIYAKEYRDQLMIDYAKQYPAYGFDRNMGYGTTEHLLALEKYGPTPIHRRTFAPVKNIIHASNQ